MTPQELKASILQLAIQGKLAPQIESEGNAEDLYREIQKEKQKLIAEKKIKKEKPLEPIKEEEIPFDIPSSWKWCHFGDLMYGTPSNGKSVKPVEVDTGIKNLTLSATTKGFFNFNAFKYVSLPMSEVEKYYLKKGDLLIQRSNSRELVGTSCIYWGDDDLFIYPDLMMRIKLSQSTDIKYVDYVLKSKTVKDYYSRKANGTSDSMPKINQNIVCHTLIPLPPLEEQKRIVAKIEELLPLVERYGKAYEKLEEFNKKFPGDMKKSILQMAIQGKLVEQRPEEGTAEELFAQIQTEKARLIKEGKIKKEKPLTVITDEEKPFDIPDSWKWVKMGDLISLISGVSYKKEDVSAKGVRVLRGGNIQNGKVMLEEDDVFLPLSYNEEIKQIRKGDNLIVASTGSKAIIGKSGYVSEEMPMTMIGAFLRIARPVVSFLNEYVRLIFSSDYYRKHIRDLSQGTNINNIRETYIVDMVIPLPPLEEQKRIVSKLEEVLPLCDALIK